MNNAINEEILNDPNHPIWKAALEARQRERQAASSLDQLCEQVLDTAYGLGCAHVDGSATAELASVAHDALVAAVHVRDAIKANNAEAYERAFSRVFAVIDAMSELHEIAEWLSARRQAAE